MDFQDNSIRQILFKNSTLMTIFLQLILKIVFISFPTRYNMYASVPLYVQAQFLNIAFLTLSSMENVEPYSETNKIRQLNLASWPNYSNQRSNRKLQQYLKFRQEPSDWEH